VSSGALLGAWHTDAEYSMLRTGGANAYGLSWSADDRHIAFRFDAYAPQSSNHLVTVRTLDVTVTAAGHDLMADRRLILQVPLGLTQPSPSEPCFASLVTPDDRSVVCGTYALPASLPVSLPVAKTKAACTSTPSFVSYSAATGKQLQVLYQYHDQCLTGVALPLWTDPSARHVIGLMMITQGKGPNLYVFGLIAAGRLTPLPALVVNLAAQPAVPLPGSIAF
jgi:hypothetical protein